MEKSLFLCLFWMLKIYIYIHISLKGVKKKCIMNTTSLKLLYDFLSIKYSINFWYLKVKKKKNGFTNFLESYPCNIFILQEHFFCFWYFIRSESTYSKRYWIWPFFYKFQHTVPKGWDGCWPQMTDFYLTRHKGTELPGNLM